MRANATRRLRAELRAALFVAAFSAASAAAASDRIFVPADGIGTSGDQMGTAVALSGDTAAVGIPEGVIAPFAAPGAIAIFRNVAGEWQREAFLGPNLPSLFALQQDMLVVGGTRVVTYVRDGTTWSQHDVINTPAPRVALSADTLLVAGTPASVYTRVGDAWTPQATLAGDHDDEEMVEIALDGDIAALVGYYQPLPGIVEAYLHFYHRAGGVWTLESTIDAGDVLVGFTTFRIAASGDTVLVGPQAYVRDQGSWSLQGTLDPLAPYTLSSIAIDGDRAIIGSSTDGIPGVIGAGTVYVFERSGGIWSRTNHLSDPLATSNAAFGTSVAIEGDTVVSGSPGATTPAGTAGDASVIDLGAPPPGEVATLDAGDGHANENFGTSFGVSGTTFVAAAPQADVVQYLPQGAAYVFGLASEGWALEAELQGPATTPYGFGTSAAASGDTIVVGSPVDNQTGAAYVYTRGDGTWPEAARLAPGDGGIDAFGETVAFDGDRIAVGAPRGAGKVFLYTGSGATWPEESVLVPSASSDGDGFGGALSLDGDTIVVGAPSAADGIEVAAGLAFVFVNTGAGWAEQAVLESPQPIASAAFGESVATRGDTAVVGTGWSQFEPQHVYVFRRSGTSWTLDATFAFDLDAQWSYVASVAISPDESILAFGMPTSFPGSGRVLTYVRAGDSWVPGRTFVDDGPGNPGHVDGFGTALAFAGENLFVGAPGDGSGGAVYEYGFGDPIFASGFDPAP